MLVLDTHVLVWWASDSTLLGSRARKAIAGEDKLGVPVIVFWEASLLVRRQRLDLGMPVREWADVILAIPRIEALPLTPEIALMADGLAMHADPADRFVVATALRYGAPLITKDRAMRRLRFVKMIW
jgi:PIN domain nuclease of toxin-antitoxin system